MADRAGAIKAATEELRDAMKWFEQEVRFWRAMGDEDRDEDGSETICFRPTMGMNVNLFIERVRSSQYLLTRLTPTIAGDRDDG